MATRAASRPAATRAARPARRQRPRPARPRPSRCRSGWPRSPTACSCSNTRSRDTRSVFVTIATFGVPDDLGELLGDEAVAGPDRLVGRQAEADDVDLGPGRAYLGVETLAQQRPRPVQPGGVEQDELGVRTVHDAAHDPPCGLRLAGRDGDLLADQRVGQGRLAGVGPADEAREPRAVRVSVLPVASVTRVATGSAAGPLLPRRRRAPGGPCASRTGGARRC